MLKINNFQNSREGIDYTAPDLEMLRIDVEQGFQGSITVYDDWYNILDPNLSWDEIDEEKFF